MMNFFKKNWILLIILVIAFILRVVGIFYAYPLMVVGDEIPNLFASLKMLGTFSFHPASPNYYYPAVISYIYLPFLALFIIGGKLVGFFGSFDSIKEIVFLSPGVFIPLVRLVSVLFGVLSVYLVYLITYKLFNKKAGLLAGWFLAISYFHSVNSHFAQTWTIQTFFILLALYFAVSVYLKEKNNWRDYLLGGFLIGLSFGVNFVGIVTYFWFFLVHILKNQGQGFVRIFLKNKNFWLLNLSLFLMVLIVYYLNPYGLNNYFARIIDTQTPAVAGGGGYSSYKPLSYAALQILFFYVTNTFIQEPFLASVAILGSIYLFLKKRHYFYFLVLWPILYYLMISPLTGAMGRYILPALPLLVIISGWFLSVLFEGNKVRKNILWILIFLASLYSIILIVVSDIRMLKQDTRVLAREWILNNVSSGAKIKNEDLGESLMLVENKSTVELIRQKYPGLFSTKRKYLLNLPNEEYPKPNYFLSTKSDMVDEQEDYFDYFILGSFNKEEVTKQALNLPVSAFLVKQIYPISLSLNTKSQNKFLSREEIDLTTDNSQFKSWWLFKKVDYNGPYIEIYKLNR